jgi:hypothetical protein
VTTTDIARRHGHTGAIACEDCGTAENLHFGSWFDPKTGQSGDFLQCCACGIKAGDPIYVHAECGAPATRYVPNVNSDAFGQLAFKRIQERAIEAYIGGRHEAATLELVGREADAHAVAAVLEAVGRAYAAAAINQVADVLTDKLDEETYLELGDTAASLDLDVVEDLDGANGTGDDPVLEVRVRHSAKGWVLPDFTDLHQCTTNHQRQQDGRPPCTAAAVWKVVEDHGMHLTIGFYCDADLPAEHRRLMPAAR